MAQHTQTDSFFIAAKIFHAGFILFHVKQNDFANELFHVKQIENENDAVLREKTSGDKNFKYTPLSLPSKGTFLSIGGNKTFRIK